MSGLNPQAAWPVPWWDTGAGAHRTAFAFLAFPPGFGDERAAALAHAAVCSAGGWTAHAVSERGGDVRLGGWRRGSGASLSLLVAGYSPLVVAMAPGDCGTATGAPTGGGLALGLAARGAVRRFVRAGRAQGARVVVPGQLPALLARSAQRSARRAAIDARRAQLTELARVRVCPRCAGGYEPGPRWCPGCEYEFSAADDHARDQEVLAWQREAQALWHEAAQLSVQAFPGAIGMPWAAAP